MDNRWLWPFELLDKLGEGGMGVVYRARYVKNDKIVAVKLLPADLDAEIVKARFERELEILKTLRHPNIVYCFGGTTEGQQRYYAMELVDGGTLEDELKQSRKLPWGKVVNYALQMCSGLAYAHERGVVHRDIKPGNFLLTRKGQLKLADFGLATVVTATKLTATGKTMGTVKYMAPEQIRGADTDPRTDLYAMGCVLFELLTGHVPFQGGSPADLMQKHLSNEPPRVSSEIFDVPEELDSLIDDLMRKNPAERPASAMEVAQRLNSISEISVVKKKNTLTGSGSDDVTKRINTPRQPQPAQSAQSSAALSQHPSWLVPVLCFLLMLAFFGYLGQRQKASGIEQSTELWKAAFKHQDAMVRIEAAAALGKLGQQDPSLVQVLVEGLNDPEPNVQARAAQSLGEVGYAGREAIPDLQKLQRAASEPVARNAADAAIRALEDATEPSSWWPWLYTLGAMLMVGVLMWQKLIPMPAFLARKRATPAEKPGEMVSATR